MLVERMYVSQLNFLVLSCNFKHNYCQVYSYTCLLYLNLIVFLFCWREEEIQQKFSVNWYSKFHYVWHKYIIISITYMWYTKHEWNKDFPTPPPPNKKALAILQVENPINWPLILFVFYSYIIALINILKQNAIATKKQKYEVTN